MVSNAADKSRRTRAVVRCVPERDGPHLLLTIKLFQWSVLAYKLTDVDYPVCSY